MPARMPWPKPAAQFSALLPCAAHRRRPPAGPYNLECTSGKSVLENDESGFEEFSISDLSVGSILAPPPLGSLTWQPDGQFLYSPENNFAGTVSFTYELRDRKAPGEVAVGAVMIIITPPADLTAYNNTYVAKPDQPYKPPGNMLIQSNDYTTNPVRSRAAGAHGRAPAPSKSSMHDAVLAATARVTASHTPSSYPPSKHTHTHRCRTRR